MIRRLVFVAILILCLSAGYAIGQRAKANVSINNDIAWFRIDGSALQGEAAKRLAFVSLHYNDVTVPCIVVDGQAAGRITGSSSISCGWTPQAIEAIGNAGK